MLFRARRQSCKPILSTVHNVEKGSINEYSESVSSEPMSRKSQFMVRTVNNIRIVILVEFLQLLRSTSLNSLNSISKKIAAECLRYCLNPLCF